MLVVNQKNFKPSRVPNNVVYTGAEYSPDFSAFGSAKDTFVGRKRTIVPWTANGGLSSPASILYAKQPGMLTYGAMGDSRTHPTPDQVSTQTRFLLTGNQFPASVAQENHGLTTTLVTGEFNASDERQLFGENSIKANTYGRIDISGASTQVSNNEWTIEFWFSALSGTANPTLYWGGNAGQYMTVSIGSGILYVGTSNGGNAWHTTTWGANQSNTPAGTWKHFAASRLNDDPSGRVILRTFIDGNQVGQSGPGTVAVGAQAASWGTTAQAHRASTSVQVQNGYYKDFAVTIGAAKYRTSFTPPTKSILQTEFGP